MNQDNWSPRMPSLHNLSEDIWRFGRNKSGAIAATETQFTSLEHLKCRCNATVSLAEPIIDKQDTASVDVAAVEACFATLQLKADAPHFGEAGWQQLVAELAKQPGVSAAFVVDGHGLVISAHGDLEHEFIEEKGSRLILAFEQIESLMNETSRTLALNIQAQESHASCWPIAAGEQSYFVIVLSEAVLAADFSQKISQECEKLSQSLS